jgi:DNA-binding Lrp family transcriptional regulator
VSRRAIDNKDRALLGALGANARESLVGLARRVGLSRSATQERLKRLEQSGVIQGYTVRVAESDAETGVRACIAISLKPGFYCEQVVPHLRNIPEILNCDSVAGAVDLVLRLDCRSTLALEVVREQIGHIPGVATVTTHVVLAGHW